jgi:hypothetical protein
MTTSKTTKTEDRRRELTRELSDVELECVWGGGPQGLAHVRVFDGHRDG